MKRHKALTEWLAIFTLIMVLGCRRSSTVSITVTDSTASISRIKSSMCDKCKTNSSVVHFRLQSGSTITNLDLCQACAINAIASIPPQQLLLCTTDTGSAKQGATLEKRYNILTINSPNQAAIRDVTSGNNSAKTMIVRTDMIPTFARVPGNTLTVRGTLLEIRLFEISGGVQ